ncbi:LOW QUALITY PROTEIN: lipase maturation factor 2 [Ornithorhynchus anatinus]|uniref:LOW QUALITY PROTEIN: lipase maturation factor 2 n=1 Tax=Ornithorhynchus anatinus TaxID=9258 RepID=UPI0010A894B7|nr:LOW QUALITY PROTEIN: lipase maturation factor 2 [Ornithorhynchus anatinus]
MGDATRLPRQLFLQGVAVAFLFAFASLYTQIPGLYGREGILPARRMLRPLGKGPWELLWESPTLLWLGPRLGLDTEQAMELLCLLGTLGSLGALLLKPLRHGLLYLLLWGLYLSLYQVGQVFLYFQWDSLLLETGFLAVLVAPLGLSGPGGRAGGRTGGKAPGGWPHEPLPFWLVRWLLFRLMFASGVVKLSSRCPTWWGLTALTYHYETQCLPTPAAWLAHQLPVWLHKLSVVATFVIEIALPPLFFAPTRRLRLAAFYAQVLLQVLIIITGNYSFFNLLTLVLTTSLLDEQHLAPWLGRTRRKAPPRSWLRSLLALLTLLVEVAVFGLLGYGTVSCFGLELDKEQRLVHSKTAFTFHEFSQWLRAVILPTVGLGVVALAWELLTALYRCGQVRGCLGKLWAMAQLSIFGAATVAMFIISLVPYTYLEPGANGRLWPGAHQMFRAVEHLQLANSYGLFRRMTGLGGRPEVVLEGSYDREHWTEIEFMFKPGNLSRHPPVVAPHQPRLDWQMWFAALGPHSHSPWFTSFVYRLLQGQREVIRLIQSDESRYPFREQPPIYIRAQLYKYWFSQPGEQGRWWRRQWVEEFYPTVSLGDPVLDSLLNQFGLKDKTPPRLRASAAPLPQALRLVREQLSALGPLAVLWTLVCTAAAVRLLHVLLSRNPRPSRPPRRPEGSTGEKNGAAPRRDGVERPRAQPPQAPTGSRHARRKQ